MLSVGRGKDQLASRRAVGRALRTPHGDSWCGKLGRVARDGTRAVRTARIGGLLLALALLVGAQVGAAQAQSTAEVAFWNRVRDSTNPDEFKAYLVAYPNGAFAETAKARLKQLAPISLRPQVPSAPGNALTEAAVIREEQQRLYNLNYDLGVLDGQLTEETPTAIRAWQKNINQEPTGEITEEELGQLRSARLPTTWGALAYAVRGASRGLEPPIAPGSRERRAFRLPRCVRGATTARS